jgi:hypothetical protein
MTFTLFADVCTSCSSSFKAYVSLLQRFCWDNNIELLMKSTKYSHENRLEAENAIKALNLSGHYSIINNYPPFIASNTGKAVLLNGLTPKNLMELI